jgi:hypothetical protein
MLGLATAYSFIILMMPVNKYSARTLEHSTAYRGSESQLQDTVAQSNTNMLNKSLSSQLTNVNKANNSLPITIKLVGISDGASSSDIGTTYQTFVLIQFQDELYEHILFDFIANTEIQIIAINKLSINIEHENVIHTIALSSPNLLAEGYQEAEVSYAELLIMKPADIGTRPRIIEHLVTLIPTPYIADGQLISPGINPELFAQAGFKSDDLLKTINGQRVTVESERENIQENIKTAQTLIFTVMRRGRLITLYLDIPSETLDLRAD